jgi:hypothetical protein
MFYQWYMQLGVLDKSSVFLAKYKEYILGVFQKGFEQLLNIFQTWVYAKGFYLFQQEYLPSRTKFIW